MKKYLVTIKIDGETVVTTLLARNSDSVIRKACRLYRVPAESVSVEYLGFYLNRVYFPVKEV